MEFKPIRTDIKVSKSTVTLATRIITIIFIFAIYILSDFVVASGGGGFVTDTAYWVKTVINLVLVVSIMITVRSMRRDKKIAGDKDIDSYMKQLEKGFKRITISGMADKFELYLDKLNDDAKYNKFIKMVQAKLIRLKNSEKNKQARIELNSMLHLPREDVLKLDINHKRITFSQVFASIDGRIMNDDENDLSTYESQSIAKMVSTKSIMVFLFSAFTTSVAFDLIMGGVSAIFGVLIKVFSLLLAVNTAMNSADDYVNHNLKTSVIRRFKILANFLNSEPNLHSALRNEPDTLQEKFNTNEKAVG